MTALEAAAAARTSLAVAADALAVLAGAAAPEPIIQAAQIIAGAPRTVTCASGSSGFVAAKFSHSLCCVERPAKFMPPAEAIHGGLGALAPGDALVMISRGGASAELLPILEVGLARGATVIALTENLDSVLARRAAVTIPLVITRESDPLEVMATTSNLVAGALLDAVLAAVIELTGYSREQFAIIHPGGAVGALLNAGQAG